jgi:hypothetical protein
LAGFTLTQDQRQQRNDEKALRTAGRCPIYPILDIDLDADGLSRRVKGHLRQDQSGDTLAARRSAVDLVF